MREYYDVTVYDPDGDRLRVYVAWGDGDTNDYGEFVATGRTASFEHAFRAPGEYDIRARCHDGEPLFSNWSSPKTVLVLER